MLKQSFFIKFYIWALNQKLSFERIIKVSQS